MDCYWFIGSHNNRGFIKSSPGDLEMSLLKKQQRFISCIGKLINYADSKGYGLTAGDAYRDPRVHGQFKEKASYSSAKSVHKIRLAEDFNLIIDGVYITNGHHSAYLDLGEYWESLDPDARWGGRFNDANHFSFEHWGCK